MTGAARPDPRRWRPSLAMVLGGALAGTLALSFIGLVVLRYLGPEIGFRNAAAILGLLIALATAALGAVLVRLLLRPIRALEAYARAEGAGPVPMHYGTRETHATAERVIAMAEALRDRETTVRAFTDHVTHELKTPVAAIRAAVELMQDGAGLGAEDLRLLQEIDGARDQMEVQLAALRQAAQAREVRYLGEVTVAQAAQDLTVAVPGLAVTVAGADMTLPLAAEGMALVLGQLARNAVAHGATSLHLHAARQGGVLLLWVRDNGRGISDGNRARIFTPFFTTRRETGGTGMGLVIVRNILGAHRAEIAALPSSDGAVFEVRFG